MLSLSACEPLNLLNVYINNVHFCLFAITVESTPMETSVQLGQVAAAVFICNYDRLLN